MFVAIFFVAGVLPEAFGSTWQGSARLRPLAVLVLGCLPYIVVYATEQVEYFRKCLSKGDPRAAALVIPAMGRAFLVLLATSGLGAALGLPEAMSIVLARAEQLGGHDERLVFFAVMVLVFVILHQALIVPFRATYKFIDRRLVLQGR